VTIRTRENGASRRTVLPVRNRCRSIELDSPGRGCPRRGRSLLNCIIICWYASIRSRR
jgi:hypothetical protein